MTVYYQDWPTKIGPVRIYFDDTKTPAQAFGIINKDRNGAESLIRGLVEGGSFLATDYQIYFIEDEPLKFFTDYLPRVLGFTAPINRVDAVTDIPDPGRRKPLPESLKLKYGIKD